MFAETSVAVIEYVPTVCSGAVNVAIPAAVPDPAVGTVTEANPVIDPLVNGVPVGELNVMGAEVVTTLLYLLIFSHVLESNVKVYEGRVNYTSFLIPGLVMMAVLQNAFANSSSSLIQSKMMRSIIFILLPPITSLEIFCAYVFGAMVRGLCVGLGVWLITFPFVGAAAAVPQQPLWVLAFAAGGSATAAIAADDQE